MANVEESEEYNITILYNIDVGSSLVIMMLWVPGSSVFLTGVVGLTLSQLWRYKKQEDDL